MASVENYIYRPVTRDVDSEGRKLNNGESKLNWIFCLRQMLVCSAIWSGYFSNGLCIGAPTVIIPQIRREANSTDAITQVMASWLSSSVAYSGTALVLIVAILPKFIGRKPSFFLITLVALIGFLILYFSKTSTHLIIGLCFEGSYFASQLTISIMIITEYTSPRYRGIFLTIKSVSFLWGIWIANTIGTFWHWKNIVLLGFAATMYNLIIILSWPESPYWLASRRRFDECATAHRWLKGSNEESNWELEKLIQRHTNLNQERLRNYFKINLKKYYGILKCRKFYKPLLLSMLTITLYNSLGKITITVYAIDIIKKITGSESSAYTGMLVLDGVTIVGMHVGCGISRIARRRSFLFLTSGFGIVFLYSLSLYLRTVKYFDVSENMSVSLFLLTSYTLSISIGPMIMSTSLLSELFPLSFRNLFVFVLATYGSFIFATFIKIGPFLFSTCGFSGACFIYASLALICLLLLYYFLPETKDKTLLEIENLFINSER